LFADQIGSLNMLFVSAALLLVPIPIISRLDQLRTTDLGNPDAQADLLRDGKLSVNPFSGFSRFLSNPYLLWIGLFILLYVMMNTFLYYEIRKAVADLDREQRAQIWASIDLAVNLLAAVTALFATGRLATKVGMAKTLALVPLVMAVGWAAVAISPAAITVIIVQVIRRAGNYSITRPGREMLFTLVDNESRFKAKPVIDTVVYRGGDVATAWFYTTIVSWFGLGLAGVAIIGAFFATLWAGVGAYLGGRFERESATASEPPQGMEEVRHDNA
jgi:AAA family ATP:ADP antiporter